MRKNIVWCVVGVIAVGIVLFYNTLLGLVVSGTTNAVVSYDQVMSGEKSTQGLYTIVLPIVGVVTTLITIYVVHVVKKAREKKLNREMGTKIYSHLQKHSVFKED